ncbi:MAG: hypothetical protein ACE5FF_01505 [Saprospiraceae bacterium]
MKSGKNISTLFREKGRSLKVQPSLQAWQKLERQLDQRASSGRIVVMRRILAVAAMLVLAFGLYWWGSSLRPDSMSLLKSPFPASLEVLENTGGCEPYCLMLNSRGELPGYYFYPEQKSW